VFYKLHSTICPVDMQTFRFTAISSEMTPYHYQKLSDRKKLNIVGSMICFCFPCCCIRNMKKACASNDDTYIQRGELNDSLEVTIEGGVYDSLDSYVQLQNYVTGYKRLIISKHVVMNGIITYQCLITNQREVDNRAPA
jgi:hypothetical protein